MKYVAHAPLSGDQSGPDDLAALARQADELGFEAIAASERLVMPRVINSRYPYGETGEVPGVGTAQNTMEMLSTLSFLAGQTSRVRLLTSVLVLPYRNPLLAAKMLATIDVLSKGRLIVGCGVGWMMEEADILGVPTAFEERGAVSDEYIQAFRELWASDSPEFEGIYLQFSDIEFAPRPFQTPHPPIWVGGESLAAVRRAAAIGDGWFPSCNNPRFPFDTPDRLAAGIGRLRRWAEASGRDPSEIDVCFAAGRWGEGQAQEGADGVRAPFSGSNEQVATDIRRYEELGVTHLHLGLSGPTLPATLERMERFIGEVVPLAGTSL